MGTIFIWPLFILLLQRFRNPGKNIFKLFAAPFLPLKKPAIPALISHISYLISYTSYLTPPLSPHLSHCSLQIQYHYPCLPLSHTIHFYLSLPHRLFLV